MSIEDAPADLVEAIRHAQLISFWQTNLPEDEMPPEYMWPFVDALNDWFLEVHARRKLNNGGGMDDDDDLTTTFKNDDPRIKALRGG